MAKNKVEIEIAVQADQAVAGLGAVQRGISATGNSAAQLQGTATGAGEGLNQVGHGAEVANTGLGKARQGVQSISEQLGVAKTQIAAFISAQLGLSAAKSVAATADEYKNLQAKIKLATGEGQLFTSSFDKVVEIAQRTSSNLEQTGLLFGKLTEAGKSAGLSTQAAVSQSLALTETINQAIQLSGGSAASSNAAITQLIQGLQGGALRGDEFNSVMEQSPRLAKALADGLGVTTGELRKLAEAGQLTSDVVINALKGQSDTLKNEFATLPPTVGRALENLSSSWTLYIGETDKATGASGTAAGAITLLANNLSTLAGYLVDAGQAAAGFYALRLAQSFTATATAAAAGTVATAANTAATAANSVAAAADAAAFKTLAADVARQTAAIGGNTVATAANTAAKSATAAATGAAAVSVGRFASILGTLKTFSLIGIITNYKDIGTAIGEAAARLAGYKDRTDEIARSDKLSAAIAADTIAMRKRMADALQDAIDKQFGLSKGAKATIAEFDKLTKAGDTSAEAIAKIGKDFDLSTIPGIRDAAAVLDKLASDGKLSATEFQDAWATALKGQDLAEFETKFKAAMLLTQKEAKKAGDALADAIARGLSGKELEAFEQKAIAAMAVATRETQRFEQVAGAELQEAVRRTGLDMAVISGGMGKASRSAINDTDAIISGLDKLKAQGVDTAQVLTASLGKGINTADSQKAIDAVRLQIEAVRKVLGDKVADGLLDQAKKKAEELKDALDKAKPGINSLAEAMKALGVVSDKTLKDTADKSKLAYDAMKANGTASTRELADGFKKYAADAIAANGGVATEAIKSQAAMNGLSITTDATGKAIVKAMGDAAAETGKLGNAANGAVKEYERLADAANKAALAAINQRYERPGAGGKPPKPGDSAGNYDPGYGSPYSKPGDDPRNGDGQTKAEYDRAQSLKGQNAVDNTLLFAIRDKLAAGTLGQADAASVSALTEQLKQNIALSQSFGGVLGTEGLREMQRQQAELALLNNFLSETRSGLRSGLQSGANQQPASSANVVNVRITLPNGTTQTVPTTQEGSQALIAALQSAKLSAGV